MDRIEETLERDIGHDPVRATALARKNDQIENQYQRKETKQGSDSEEQGLAYIQNQLSRIGDFQIVADVFKQLCDPTRIRIFWLLCHREERVLDISAWMQMSSPAVSHHLRSLKNSGLIVSRRKGKEVYYRAADTNESRLLHPMIEQVMEITCPQ